MRKFVFIVTLLYTVAVAGLLWVVSDGFRESLLFGQSVIVTTLAASAIVAVLVAILAWWKENEWFAVLLVGVIVGSGWYAANTHHEAYGEWIPSRFSSGTERSGLATLNASGENITYQMELRNPGTISHREYLVVHRGGLEKRIRLPVFEEKRSGYISAKKPEDWIVLRPTETPDVYRVEIGTFLFVKKAFRVNLQTKKVATIN